MALVSHVVAYNLVHRVPHVLFGSSVGGQYAVMSMPVTIALQQEFCATYGLDYRTPLLEDGIVKAQERVLLDAAGVFRGYRFLDKHSGGNQGYCLLSVQHLPDVLFGLHPTYDPARVERCFRDKAPLCHAWIRDQVGDALPEAVRALSALTGKAAP